MGPTNLPDGINGISLDEPYYPGANREKIVIKNQHLYNAS